MRVWVDLWEFSGTFPFSLTQHPGSSPQWPWAVSPAWALCKSRLSAPFSHTRWSLPAKIASVFHIVWWLFPLEDFDYVSPSPPWPLKILKVFMLAVLQSQAGIWTIRNRADLSFPLGTLALEILALGTLSLPSAIVPGLPHTLENPSSLISAKAAPW